MRLLKISKKRGLVFSLGFVFALLCFITLNAAMRPVSKSEYCGTACHEMNTAYNSWTLSVHGANQKGLQAECIDCHLPSKDKYFSHVFTKMYIGGRDIYKHYYKHFFDGEYDVAKAREQILSRMPNEKCMVCHVNLLARPSNSAARLAHIEALNPSEQIRLRCVECHEDVGHQRQSKIYVP